MQAAGIDVCFRVGDAGRRWRDNANGLCPASGGDRLERPAQEYRRRVIAEVLSQRWVARAESERRIMVFVREW